MSWVPWDLDKHGSAGTNLPGLAGIATIFWKFPTIFIEIWGASGPWAMEPGGPARLGKPDLPGKAEAEARKVQKNIEIPNIFSDFEYVIKLPAARPSGIDRAASGRTASGA